MITGQPDASTLALGVGIWDIIENGGSTERVPQPSLRLVGRTVKGSRGDCGTDGWPTTG
jgi:hypothetical protein